MIPLPSPLTGNTDFDLQQIVRWQSDVYAELSKRDINNIAVTTTDAAPSGGEDGDIHIRKDGANTAIYLNKNGSWSAYTNP